VEITIEELPVCQADPSMLKQVFVNLLSNALKFTRHREVAVIRIGYRTEGSKNIYFVKDNGVGFETRYANKLFGVFQRLHRAEDYEGTGVGLAIVQRVIHRHGGRCGPRQRSTMARYFTSLSQGDYPMPDKQVEILLVEDNPFDVEMTLHAFKKHNLGNRVHVVRDGAEALEFVFCTGAYANRRIGDIPKIILLDLKLPKVDGLEVLQRIKGDPRTRATPVVVLTSSQEERDIAETYQLGVNSYIVKPVDFDKFTEAARTLGLYWLLLNQSPPVRGNK
jgi:two-component system response regulator